MDYGSGLLGDCLHFLLESQSNVYKVMQNGNKEMHKDVIARMG